ncbi:MAG: S41 family peptidase [Anaerolineae bacterium]|nr:S41 family peptidase [Anaerolineae bacterium]
MAGFLKAIIILMLSLFVAMLAFAAGFGTNYFYSRNAPASVVASASATTSSQIPDKFGLMWESWNVLKDQFYYDIPAKNVLVHGMIRGALQSLGDPHTILVEPAPAQQEATSLQGNYGGIGAKVEVSKGQIVLLPFPDGPADKAGILPGDRVVKIGEDELKPEDTPDSVETKLRGEVGSTVNLTLNRIGVPDDIVVDIVRQEIDIPTVQYRMLDGTDYGYIQVTLESGDTPKEFDKALAEVKKNNPKGIVLDLRNNPGGLFPDPALEIVGQFLPNVPVVIEKYRDGTEKTYNSKAGNGAGDIPFVVLVNSGTASAAEIIAGAFLDSGKTALIGERTFGKGSVQGLYPLSDKSVLHITTAKWLTPKGGEIEGVGLKPNIQIPLTPEDAAKGIDPQLDRAILYLTNGK